MAKIKPPNAMQAGLGRFFTDAENDTRNSQSGMSAIEPTPGAV